jgi:hypothetical protein
MIPAAFTALGLALAFAGELTEVTPDAKPGPVWGTADVQPTPEHPVYFRHTCGYYPGAAPPLEWCEGTPTTKKVTGIFGNPPRRGEVDALDFADQKSKNILWKVPVPGRSLSHPIVVESGCSRSANRTSSPAGIWIPASNSGSGGSCPCCAMG